MRGAFDPRGIFAARIPSVLLLLLGLPFTSPAAAAGFTPPVPVTRTLPNGLRVAVFSSHRLPIVEMTLLLPAGQTAESANESGAAALTASLLLRGTASRDAASFEAALVRLGGSLSSNAGRDVASVDGQFLAGEFAAGLELLSDAVLNPVFDEREVAADIARARRTVQRIDFDPATRAELQMWSLVLGDRAYGRPALGRDSTLRAMTPGALSEFYRLHYRPDQAVLVVAGDVAADSVFAAAEERFG
ncbi:MAG: M16 family metallopeptidase, partial [Candidatus Eiseniibacteriota bacterium]